MLRGFPPKRADHVAPVSGGAASAMQQHEPVVTRAAFGDVNGPTFGVGDAIALTHLTTRCEAEFRISVNPIAPRI
jgi:hypothetical protein